MKKLIKSAVCSVTLIIGIILIDYSDEIRTSQAGLEIIGNAESCRNEPYHCPANILTVGIGSTTGTIEQRKYSDEEIAQRWVEDLKEAEQCVNQYANGDKLPQSVFDATVSITFNVGCSKMKSSSIFKYLNTSEYEKACNELPRWNKAGGKVLRGLVVRREKERKLCLLDLSSYQSLQ